MFPDSLFYLSPFTAAWQHCLRSRPIVAVKTADASLRGLLGSVPFAVPNATIPLRYSGLFCLMCFFVYICLCGFCISFTLSPILCVCL